MYILYKIYNFCQKKLLVIKQGALICKLSSNYITSRDGLKNNFILLISVAAKFEKRINAIYQKANLLVTKTKYLNKKNPILLWDNYIE